jgi:two-component system sensor histidine kinase MprB
LALVLVVFAGNRIEYQNRLASRAQVTAGVEHDADVLAARTSRVYGHTGALSDVIADENRGSRPAAVVGSDGSVLAGPVLTTDPRVQAAVDRALAAGVPSTAGVVAGSVVSVSPVVIDQAVVGVALEAEELPRQSSGFLATTLSDWPGIAIVVAAALLGWFLAGRATRPIVALTEQARGVALGRHDFEVPSSSVPEVATLTAAISGINRRERKLDGSEGERRQTLRTLVRRVSHQLRTPLSVLRLRLDDLQDPTLTEERRALVAEVMARQIDLLDELGEELAAMDPARGEIARSPVDVSAVVLRVVDRHSALARWGGVSLRLGATPTAIVIGDESLLEDAVTNVVQNAVKFTPRGGRIVASVDVRSESVTVTVADSGPGIQEGERAMMSQSGVRGSASASVGGTGHGLALVADALDRHGGHLELGGAAGGGAVVRLVLPVDP